MLILSPRRAVEAFVDMHNAEGAALGANRAVMMNGISPTLGEMVDALRRIAGEAVAGRVDWVPEPEIQRIVDSWPFVADGEPARALAWSGQASGRERGGHYGYNS